MLRGILENDQDGRVASNSRNGHGRKTEHGKFGQIELITPRDRNQPQIIPKEDAILALYSKGMTIRDIQATLQELYHVEVSHSLISKVTEVVKEEVELWLDRSLEAVYPVV